MDSNWFNKCVKLQKYIPYPEEYKKKDIEPKYKNILFDLKKNKSKHLFNLNNQNEINDTFFTTYKYKINFSKNQHTILKNYFKECYIIYNLCVDIWKDYKDMTDNWMILKDAIYDIVYRDNSYNMKQNKKLIIERLKENKKKYDLENEQNKEKINQLKEIEKEKYKKGMEEYKKIIKNNKNSTIINKISKPRMKKIKIEKVKNPPKERRNKIKKPAPDETLKGEIKTFCSNLKSARTNSYNNNNNPFELTYKNISKKQTIIVNNRNISSKGIFSNALKELKCKNFKNIIKKYQINQECKLLYDKTLNGYYLYILVKKNKIEIKNRKEVVAIDEGEKIFASFYSVNEIGNLGKDMRIKILGIQNLIKQYQKKIKNKKYKKKKKSLKKKIAKCFNKIKGYVNEVHKKASKYLCENYKNILLPVFETKPMISKNKIKIETEKIKKLSKEEGKEKIKKLNKQIRMSKKVKFVLSMQKHYKFKEYLKALGERYKTVIYDVNEAYTSQVCTKCGIKSKEYTTERIKKCSCGYKIDRDMNGSRNILLKCINELN